MASRINFVRNLALSLLVIAMLATTTMGDPGCPDELKTVKEAGRRYQKKVMVTLKQVLNHEPNYALCGKLEAGKKADLAEPVVAATTMGHPQYPAEQPELQGQVKAFKDYKKKSLLALKQIFTEEQNCPPCQTCDVMEVKKNVADAEARLEVQMRKVAEFEARLEAEKRKVAENESRMERRTRALIAGKLFASEFCMYWPL